MSQQTKPETTEMTQTQKIEEPRGNNQPSVDAPVVSLKIEQVEERANPLIIC